MYSSSELVNENPVLVLLSTIENCIPDEGTLSVHWDMDLNLLDCCVIRVRITIRGTGNTDERPLKSLAILLFQTLFCYTEIRKKSGIYKGYGP